MTEHDVVVIGGGPAGLAAALAVKKAGVDDVIIIERDSRLGGILNQCIHNGFGLQVFGEELTGPEYADRYIELVENAGIKRLTDAMVISINRNKEVVVSGKNIGFKTIRAKSVILSMGCRERARGSLNIPGTRPAGIFSAGTAQRLMNIEGSKIGKEIVILGSGDIGLIMARRLTLEGAKVKMVVEIMDKPGGLTRNIVQCLDDFGIPLVLNHTVTRINGKSRIESVTVSEVDSDKKPIPGTEQKVDCDTLLLSVGLIPENELSREIGLSINRFTKGANISDLLETEVPGIFACGNVLHVHDLVDNVSKEAERAGIAAANYVLSGASEKETKINIDKPFVVKKEEANLNGDTMTCIGCPLGCNLSIKINGDSNIKKYRGRRDINPEMIAVTGNHCGKGIAYATEEILSPKRFITSTVAIDGGEVGRLPVKTQKPILKTDISKVMDEIGKVNVKAPIKAGSIVIENCAGTGIHIVATKTVLAYDETNI